MNFFGARKPSEQYIPKRGACKPGWAYRAARRNAARAMHWPARYRWRVWLREMIKQALEKMGDPAAIIESHGKVLS